MPHGQRGRVGRHIATGSVDKLLYRFGMRSAAELTLPDFLGIGAQKSGTTWLHDNLSRDPGLHLPTLRKELHCFDEDWHAPLAGYASYFSAAGARVKGEITPAYGLLPRGRIRFIRRVMPDLKLILLILDPVERAWSHAFMNLVQGPKLRVEDIPEARFVAHFQSPGSIGRGDYLGIIGRWTQVFPAERLLVGFYDDVRDEPEALLTRIFAFLGVDTEVDWAKFPVRERILPHQAAEEAPPILPRLESVWREAYRDDQRRLAARFGERVAAWAR